MTNSLPTITTKQQEILKLIYRYRFLNRTQIQALLRHKDKRRIISWLKDLRDKQYVDWHYDATDFIAKSKPAIYYLSLNGVRYLREAGGSPAEELRKRYKEPGRTQVFIDRCLLIADCCIALQAKSNAKSQYCCILPADYIEPESPHRSLIELKPHLFFSKREDDGGTNYILENFEATLPRYQVRRRLAEYTDYLADQGNGFIALFICASTADLLYIKRRVHKVLENFEEDELVVRLTILDKVKDMGVASSIWEDV